MSSSYLRKEIDQAFTMKVGQHLKNVFISGKQLPRAAHLSVIAMSKASYITQLDRVFLYRSFSIIKDELIQPLVQTLNEIKEHDLDQISDDDQLIISRRQLVVAQKFALDDLVIRKSCDEILNHYLLQRNFPFLFYRFDSSIRVTAKFNPVHNEDSQTSDSHDSPFSEESTNQQAEPFTNMEQTKPVPKPEDTITQTAQTTLLAVQADDDESDDSDSSSLNKSKGLSHINGPFVSIEEDNPSTSDESFPINLENVNVAEQTYFFSTVSVFSPDRTSEDGSPGPSTLSPPLLEIIPSNSRTVLPQLNGSTEPASLDDLDDDSQLDDQDGYLYRDGQGKMRARGILTSKQRRRLSPTGLKHYLEVVRPSRIPIVKAKMQAKRERDAILSEQTQSVPEPQSTPNHLREGVTFKFKETDYQHPPRFIKGCKDCEDKRRMRSKLDKPLRERLEASDLARWTPGPYSRCRHFSK